MGLRRRGIYYSLDALLAGILLVAVAAVLLNLSFYEPDIEQKSYLTQDMLNILSELKIGEFSNVEFVKIEIDNGNITNLDKSVLDQIGEFWAKNMTDKSEELFLIIFNDSLPDPESMQFSLADDTIFLKNDTLPSTLVSGRRMISGIVKGKSITGYSSSGYLKRIRNRKTSSYAYLGGFVGQGNITFYLKDLPSDMAPENVIDVYLEGDFRGNFTLEINDDTCGSTYLPTSPPAEIDIWDLTSCNDSFIPGDNKIEIIFVSNISHSYVAGGFLRLGYVTDDVDDGSTYGEGEYNFPGIDGVANLYDSFYIPGDLQSMTLDLHFNSDQQTYLTIGERVIEINGTGGDQWFSLTNDDFLNNYSFDYDLLSRNTVPIRFAAYNVTVEEIVIGDLDVVIITDFSGSMKKAVDGWTQGTGDSNCDSLYTNEDARKTHLARCLDNEVVDIIMNYSGNRMWPVFFHDDDVDFYNNPDDADAIKGYISSFGPQGKEKTCLACALNQAYDIFDNYGNENKTKAVIFMTDGTPTHCADGSCTSTSTEYGNELCAGYCDTTGSCNSGDQIGCDITDLSCLSAEDNTIASAERLVADFNASIFTVGFGAIGTCTRAGNLLQYIADLNNGTYQYSDNVTELRLIYENISYSILTRVTQENQSVAVAGNVTNSNLYSDSVIEFEYNPIAAPTEPGKISVNFEIPLDQCSESVYIYEGVQVTDAKVTSYSGINWADMLVVNSDIVFNLSNYYVPYYKLGDPLVIQIPVNNLTTGNNNLLLGTGSSADNRSGCSGNNSFIYEGLVNSSTSRSSPLDIANGCNWSIQSENDVVEVLLIPDNYAGTKKCYYTENNITYDSRDAYDSVTFDLLDQLDPDGNQKIVVELSEADIEITVTLVSGVPYLWGPSIASTNVWT